MTQTMTSLYEELQQKMPEATLLNGRISPQFSEDFGRLVSREPNAVVQCRTAQEVSWLVKFANVHQTPINIRGQAHSQNGSSTSASILLDTANMQQIIEVDEENLTVTCEAGLTWRDLVEATLAKGLIPPVLTNNLGVSIAGTLSVAGLGVASFRHGTQADNVLELEVVTGTGEIVVCSPEQNQALFDVVRAGLGQFGVITRAKLKLRRCAPNVRKYYLLYDDMEKLMADCALLMNPEDGRFDTLEAWCVPSTQGVKKIGPGMELGKGMQFFAYWTYPLHVTVEFDEETPDDDTLLEGLNYYRHLHSENFSQKEFCLRLEPVFELWQRSGYWEYAHPWMETILPWQTSQPFVENILANFPPNALGPGGHILFWPCRTEASTVPLFKYPPGENVLGWGILPGIPQQYVEEACQKLDMVSEMSIMVGGKRYLSGFLTFDTVEKWQKHFGDSWGTIVEAKKQFDPNHILACGLIQYE